MKNSHVAKLRAAVISRLRSFFDERGYLEVDTPLLAPALIPEPHIEVFATEFHAPDRPADEPPHPRFLVPSPEIWMKQLLTSGYGDIYQLAHCFRNHESIGVQHNPEFTMLEWYTTGATYLDAADIAEELLAAVVAVADPHSSSDTSAGVHREEPLSGAAFAACTPPAERLTVAEAFERYARISAEVFTDPRELEAAARTKGMLVKADESADDLFQRLFLTHVEPALPRDHPVILQDYPAFVPTLAERVPGTPFARRWELYVAGLEIANCYGEERNRAHLEEYLRESTAAKESAIVPHPPDRSLLGFHAAPPCSGVALGVDRLIMALTGTNDIREVIF